MKLLKEHTCFGGKTQIYQHDSSATKTAMKFSTLLPLDVSEVDSAIIWLSGLTCNEENFITKAGAQKFLKGTKTMIICPDTSPRGLDLAGEDESYDFGTGAGFYLNATKEPYATNYHMYDYICKEIVELLKGHFSIEKISIMGHSMGGHGALVLGLRNPDIFESVSAFSPIVNPSRCAWGKKAFSGYLGDNEDQWSEYDSCELVRAGKKRSDKILIDQGLADEFLEDQLLTKNFEEACASAGQEIELRYHTGYDHSYYFISSFIEEHIRFHLKEL